MSDKEPKPKRRKPVRKVKRLAKAVDPQLQKEAADLLRSKRTLVEKPSKPGPRQSAASHVATKVALPERQDFEASTVRENGRPRGNVKNQRTDRQRKLDDTAIARMVVLGYTVKEIAARLDLSESTVNHTVDRMEDILRERALEDLGRQRAAQSMQLDGLLQECLEGIRETKKPHVSTTTEVNRLPGVDDSPGPDGKKTAAQILAGKQRVLKKVTERTADVNYIFASTDVIKTQMKLLGTSAPQELRMVIEEREAGKKAIMDALLAEVKDPALLARILDRVEASMEGGEATDIVAESDLEALTGDESEDADV